MKKVLSERLFLLWVDYRIHHFTGLVAKYALGLILLAAPAGAVAVHTLPIHHKASAKPPVTVSKPDPQVQPPPKKTSAATPPPKTDNPAAQVAAAAPLPVAQPKPVPASQPSPGSGAKKLAPAPAATPPATNTAPAAGDPSATTTSPDTSPAPQPADTQTPAYAAGGYTSINWAGYVATAGSYKHVASAWVVPNATGNGSTTTADSTWIGIGGVFSGDLIQTGTVNQVSASGKVSSFAFYELLPDPALEITSMTVSPGDSMSAAIDEITSGSWTISITDKTTGGTYSTAVSYTSSYSTAEWIEEDPSYLNGSLVPFDHFTPAVFSGGTAGSNGAQLSLSAANSSPITLVDSSGNALAKPTVLAADGSGFEVIRQ